MVDVTVYIRPGCPFCIKTEALLNKKGVKFKEIIASEDPAIRAEMRERSGRNTFPQVFVGDVHVGGNDDLYALEAAGRLDGLLATGKLD